MIIYVMCVWVIKYEKQIKVEGKTSIEIYV